MQEGTSRRSAIAVAILAVVVIGAWYLVFHDFNNKVDASRAGSPSQTSPVADSGTGPAEDRPAELVRPDGRPLNVVIAGDSLTFGLYASAEAKAWRPLTVAALGKDGPVQISGGGEDGDKAKTVLDTIAPAADTDLIVIEIGTNDVYKTPNAQFAQQYRQLVEKVKTSAPNARLLCLGVWQNADANRNFDPMIQRPCGAAGGTFVPLYDLFEDTANRGPAGQRAFGGKSDEFHPNDAGHSAISARVLDALGV